MRRERAYDAGRPARVAFWAGTFERAGTQRFLVELLRRIDRARFEPVVLSTYRVGVLLEEIDALGVQVREFGTGTSVVSPRTLRGLGGAVAFLRRERIDILNSMLGITTLFGPFVGRAAGVPVVVNHQRALGYWLRGRARPAIYGYVSRRLVDAVLVNSGACVRELTTRFGVDPGRVVLLGGGVDARAFDVTPDPALRGDLGLEGAPVVGIVAKLSPVKGHGLFLRAARLVADARPEVRFLVVGDGSRRRELETMADELGLAASVRFVGAREDVPSLLKVMDVFALSSRSEACPNSLLEAMAAGLPVVATRVGGVPDVVEEGASGLLVDPADPAGMAGAVLGLLGDEERAATMGRRGRALVRERHDIDAVVRRVEETYARLLASAARPRRSEAGAGDALSASGAGGRGGER